MKRKNKIPKKDYFLDCFHPKQSLILNFRKNRKNWSLYLSQTIAANVYIHVRPLNSDRNSFYFFFFRKSVSNFLFHFLDGCRACSLYFFFVHKLPYWFTIRFSTIFGVVYSRSLKSRAPLFKGGAAQKLIQQKLSWENIQSNFDLFSASLPLAYSILLISFVIN